jgi:hypothetical protein
MNNCLKCQEEGRYIKNSFDTVTKTYYKISDTIMMCYRHWHQSNRPDYVIKGDYDSVNRTMKK